MNAVAELSPERNGRQTQSISVSESSRVMAEIQAALTVASARPRDEMRCIDAIKTSCQRQRLAEAAEYSYSKGGSDISGPSVRLLECCARHWGNLNYGFRELAQGDGESTVEAFAWDLQSNTKEVRTFVVPHRIKARGSFKTITDPREIYELIANQSQRRVRACLEHVIPRDVWEEAVDECRKTVSAQVEINDKTIKALLAAFKEFGVTQKQVEKRIQRNITAITPAQFLSMRRVYNSLKDGLSQKSDWFDDEAVSASDVMDSVGSKKTESKKPKEFDDKAAPPQWEVVLNDCEAIIAEHPDPDEITAAYERLEKCDGMPVAEIKRLGGMMNQRLKEL